MKQPKQLMTMKIEGGYILIRRYQLVGRITKRYIQSNVNYIKITSKEKPKQQSSMKSRKPRKVVTK